MKLIHALVALTMAALFTATFTFAHGEGEGEEGIEKRIKLMVMSDSEPIEIDGSDLEVGESRQIFSDSGQEVVISREEDGYTVTVDGEEIQIGGDHHLGGLLHGDHGAHKIFVKHLGDGDGNVEILGADGDFEVHMDHDFDWHEADGEHKVRVMKLGDFKSPAQRLQESGVLDNVDDATREEILEVLRESGPNHHGKVQRIFIEKHDGGDEEDEEN